MGSRVSRKPMLQREGGPAPTVREYGEERPVVVLLHGGPGAPGYMAPVARGLAGDFRVLEPLQRRSGDKPLTVARHVADLHEILVSRGVQRPALIGHSWGAMLALTYAVAYPEETGSLVLIGCGTFDARSRERLWRTLRERTDETLKVQMEALSREYEDPDERLRVLGSLVLPVYSHDLAVFELEGLERCDARGYEETWNDMLRLQAEGYYPEALAAIEAPVLMLHGSADPHPGDLIRSSLQPYIPWLVYREWGACGHYPWLERAVGEEFFEVLKEWLLTPCGSLTSPDAPRVLP